MVTRHFFKILAIFIAMIVLGLAALFAVSYFNGAATDTTKTPQVAK